MVCDTSTSDRWALNERAPLLRNGSEGARATSSSWKLRALAGLLATVGYIGCISAARAGAFSNIAASPLGTAASALGIVWIDVPGQVDPVMASDLEVLAGNCDCLLYTSPSPRDATLSRMPSSA